MLTPIAEEKLRELASSEAARVAVDYLRRVIADGSDLDCYKINAFRLAAETGLERREAVRACLFAARLGVLDLSWDIHCPSCGGTPDYHKHLMKLERRAHCSLCELDWELDFAEQVEVTFTVNPDIRRIAYRDFRDRSYPEHLEYFQSVNGREGRAAFAIALAAAGSTFSLDVILEPGEYRCEVPGHPEGALVLAVAGEPAAGERSLALTVGSDGALDVRRLELAPGPARLTVRFEFNRPGAFPKWPFVVWRLGALHNWVSAAYLTAQQDFRDLFSGEFLAPDVSFAIRHVTLMFTDIRGSTEMYERLGDARAYKLVQDHFRLMTTIIREHEGGIVKTIGDAVMAAFPVNRDAVAAACRVQSEFAARSSEIEGIEVKIGLHRGPTIAVTSNRALDYFGRTVNIAARVQGRSRPREVLLSQTVLSDPAVRALLDEGQLATESFEATLKGVEGAVQLVSVRPA